MRILFYGTKAFEKPYLEEANKNRHQLEFKAEVLCSHTALTAKGFDAISIFTNDDASAPVIRQLSKTGIKYIAIRSSGFDNCDIRQASQSGIVVANIPEHAPHSVAEHTLALMLNLSRKIQQAQRGMQEHDFSLDKLIGFDLYKKKVGIIGTGRIGSALARMLYGFGCMILAHDVVPNQRLQSQYNIYYLGLNSLCSMCDVITIHLPLNEQTKYLMDQRLIRKMKYGTMLINTARGALVKTEDVLAGLLSGQIGSFGADVYEKEKGVYFFNHSENKMADPLLNRLLSMENVLLTPHLAFATRESLQSLAMAVFHNLDIWSNDLISEYELTFRTPPDQLKAQPEILK